MNTIAKNILALVVFSFLLFLATPQVSAQSLEYKAEISGVTAGSVIVKDKYAFLIASGVLKVINISDSNTPYVVTSIEIPNCYLSAPLIHGDYLYLGQEGLFCIPNSSLQIYNISDPGNPVQIGMVNAGKHGSLQEMVIEGNFLYGASAQGGLKIFDISNKIAPSLIAVFAPGGFNDDFRGIDVISGTVYLAEISGELWSVDVANPLAPVHLDTALLNGNGRDVNVIESMAYVSSGSGGLESFEVSDPSNITFVGGWSSPTQGDSLVSVEVSGDLAVLAHGQGGVNLLDISDPTNPLFIDNYTTPGSQTGGAQDVAVTGNLILIANFQEGLLILGYGGLGGGNILNVPLMKQTDPLWGGLTYDHSSQQFLSCGSTMAQCGCATTSLAMLLKYHGVDKAPNGSPTTPQAVNEYFNSNSTCDAKGCKSKGYAYGSVIWEAAGWYSQAANASHGTQKVDFTGSGGYSPALVSSELANQNPVVLQVPGPQHWVVATGEIGNTFTINDPGFLRTTLDNPAYGNTALRVRTYEKTNSDFSSFMIHSPSPTQILVTDSQGRRTGYDYNSDIILEEIPDSYYTLEEAYADATNPSVTTGGVYSLVIHTPQPDNFKVEITPFENGLYSYSVHASTIGAEVSLGQFSDEGQIGIPEQTTFFYSPDNSSDPVFSINTSVNVVSGGTKVPVIKSGAKGFLPVEIFALPGINLAQVLDFGSTTFGPTGDEDSLGWCLPAINDLNEDGIQGDLRCFFDLTKTGFSAGDNSATFKGMTHDGVSVVGSQTIVVK